MNDDEGANVPDLVANIQDSSSSRRPGDGNFLKIILTVKLLMFFSENNDLCIFQSMTEMKDYLDIGLQVVMSHQTK